MDTMTPQQRSALMSRIRGKDTGPELRVRRIAHAAGYRYRLHGSAAASEARHAPGGKLPGGRLPGKPDLVFASRRKVVFVNGCFWHAHDCAVGRRAPTSNVGFWADKRGRNAARDAANAEKLAQMGWEALTLWECQLRDPDAVLERLRGFLDGPGLPGPGRAGAATGSTAVAAVPADDTKRDPDPKDWHLPSFRTKLEP